MDKHPQADAVAAAIKAKFASREWTSSPYRKHAYALAQYKIDMVKQVKFPKGDKKRPKYIRYTACNPITYAHDIKAMLFARKAKAKTDPYAAWDYVTCTLSEAELMRVAKALQSNRVELDWVE